MRYMHEHKNVRKVFLVLFIVLIPFTDFPLQDSALGFFGASPAIFPLTAYAVLSLYRLPSASYTPSTLVMATLIASYIVAVSIYGLVISPSEVRGEFVVIKGLKLTIIYGLFFYVAYVFSTVKLDTKLSSAVQVAYLVSLAGLIIDPMGEINFFHYAENLNARPRGFSMEASHLAAALIPLATLAAVVQKRTYIRWAYIAVAVIALFHVQSKGGIVVLPLVIWVIAVFAMIGGLVRRTAKRSEVLFGLIIIAITAGGGLSLKMADRFQQWLSNKVYREITVHTSISTRLAMMEVTWNSVVTHPLGVGPFGWITAVDQGLSAVSRRDVNLRLEGANMTEFRALLEAFDDKNLSTKTFAGDMTVMFGWPFLVVFHLISFILVFVLVFKRQWVMAFGLAYSWFALSTFISGPPLYALALIYGIAGSRVCTLVSIRRVSCVS